MHVASELEGTTEQVSGSGIFRASSKTPESTKLSFTLMISARSLIGPNTSVLKKPMLKTFATDIGNIIKAEIDKGKA